MKDRMVINNYNVAIFCFMYTYQCGWIYTLIYSRYPTLFSKFISAENIRQMFLKLTVAIYYFASPLPSKKNPGIYKSKVPLLPYLPSFGSLLPFLSSLFQIFSPFPLLSIFFSAFRGEGRTRLWEGRAWGWGYIQNFSTEFRLTNNFFLSLL